jgi:hypothetical protein
VLGTAKFRKAWLALASLGVFLGVLAVADADAGAQQPRQDEREIAPTPGVTPIDTPASARTSVTPDRRRTPLRTQTPSARGASASASTGSGGGSDRPRGDRRSAEARDSRNAATWSLFSVLVVALGYVTIRMRRHRFDPETLLELMDLQRDPRRSPLAH